MLEEVIGEVAVDRTTLSETSDAAPKAPRMKYSSLCTKAQLCDCEWCAVIGEKLFVSLVYEQMRAGKSGGNHCAKRNSDLYTNGIKSIGDKSK